MYDVFLELFTNTDMLYTCIQFPSPYWRKAIDIVGAAMYTVLVLSVCRLL
jgi:hypothetical protein